MVGGCVCIGLLLARGLLKGLVVAGFGDTGLGIVVCESSFMVWLITFF